MRGLADFEGYRTKWLAENPAKTEDDFEKASNVFEEMPPISGAIDAVHKLAKYFDVYICSTVSWKNTSGASGKMMWIKKYFGEGPENPFYKKVVLTHNKHLNIGDFLIDHRAKNGASEFSGEWIQFGSEKFPDWNSVIEYLKNNYKKP